MKTKIVSSLAVIAAAVSVATPSNAREGGVPHGIPHLDHVFVILMENHGYSQILGNPSAPFMNA